jgi:hypothetical protein
VIVAVNAMLLRRLRLDNEACSGTPE